jgi:hypothetical protein
MTCQAFSTRQSCPSHYEGYQFGIAIVSTILGSGIGGFPFQICTPENRQQQFLDR